MFHFFSRVICGALCDEEYAKGCIKFIMPRELEVLNAHGGGISVIPLTLAGSDSV